jgi:hypothetical protein
MMMKKIITLVSTVALLLLITLSLAGCGGDTSTPSEPASAPSNSSTPSAADSTPSTAVSLVDVTTDNGISLKLPSDMTVQSEGQYASADSTEVFTYDVTPAPKNPLADLTEEALFASYSREYKNAVTKNYQTGLQLNGKEAVLYQLTLTSSNDVDVNMSQVIVTDGTNNYIIALAYPSDQTDNALAQNLQTILESITIK